uniref:Uncharacterized protein n=1 Tax=Zeugodacus cucurbitae TaxID=28588 RepID=A0A0A1XRS5_ZEUCU
MSWRLGCLVLAALAVWQTHGKPLIEDATFSDVDLVAEDSHTNAVYVAAPARIKRTPQFFGFHNHPPPGFNGGNPFDSPYGAPPGYYRNPPHYGPPGHGHHHDHYDHHGHGHHEGPPGYNNRPPVRPQPTQPPMSEPAPTQPTIAPVPVTTPAPVLVTVAPTIPTTTTTTTPEPFYDIDIRFGN